MQLELTPHKYSEFLKEFRDKDRSATSGDETVVEYAHPAGTTRYYFRAFNFMLFAYEIGNKRIALRDYQHVSAGVVNRDSIIDALTSGGGGGDAMNAKLSRVVALISEAARSTVVEKKMRAVLGGGSATANLDQMALLFTTYMHTAQHWRLMDPNGRYTANWRPLTKDDYLIYMLSAEYGSKTPVDKLGHWNRVNEICAVPSSN